MGAGVMKGAEGGGKRRRRTRRRSQPMAEINVTPFVDVMLVLLIIFMVAAPLLTVGVPVELPKTAANPLPGEQEEPLAITIAADGTLAIMNSPVAPEELVNKLRAVAVERASQRIYLRADGALPYEMVVQVMGALNAAGFSDIGLVTDIGGPDMGDN
ncbi:MULTISPECIES: protein TolR [Shimia]|uniref:protein TolR n=1 Tax=Shimia TaxID=573139 RepID=UPI001FB327AD|nr:MULTISPECIES: protein TolR [Shimia]MDV4145755.1 protein TolR [Shimia sp. FJ5]